MLIQQITLPHLHETNLRQCWAYLVLTQNKKNSEIEHSGQFQRHAFSSTTDHHSVTLQTSQ